MGLAIQWAVRCNDEKCIQRVHDSLKKLEKPFFIQETKSSIIVCTDKMGEEHVCISLRFEPWEKALEQSYVMQRAKFRVIGFNDPVFEGQGSFGHRMPEDMMKLIDGREARCSWETLKGEPVLGKGGYQTGEWIKTQYAGIEHHIKACKILDTIKENADKMIIGDDGNYCGDGDKHDMTTLVDSFEEYADINIKIGSKLKNAGWKDENIVGNGKETYQRRKLGK